METRERRDGPLESELRRSPHLTSCTTPRPLDTQYSRESLGLPGCTYGLVLVEGCQSSGASWEFPPVSPELEDVLYFVRTGPKFNTRTGNWSKVIRGPSVEGKDFNHPSPTCPKDTPRLLYFASRPPIRSGKRDTDSGERRVGRTSVQWPGSRSRHEKTFHLFSVWFQTAPF